jgi:RNA polymerase sigma factor (sigma-70 family)
MPEIIGLKDQNSKLGIRLLEGDEGVQEDIIRLWQPQIREALKYKYKDLFNEADIEDIVAEAILRLWQSRESYDEGKGSIRTLLFKIADNFAKDILRNGWKKAKNVSIDIESYATPFPSGNVVDVCLSEGDQRRLKDLKRIVDQLPKDQKYIIMADAHATDGKANSEYLSDELQIPSGTVRVKRKRALDKIKEELRRLGHKLP